MERTQSKQPNEANQSELSAPSAEFEYALFVKKDCPTCALLEPVFEQLQQNLGPALAIFSQDDASFPSAVSNPIDDTALEHSYKAKIEFVPTLIKRQNGVESGRVYGWDKQQWREFTQFDALAADSSLPEFRPGCGSKTLEPGMEEQLQLRYEQDKLKARKLLANADDDLIETCYEKGWSDGLPVVPPTPIRVLRMLNATECAADEIIGLVPPDRAPCSVEKVAINAVLAGCTPEYFPVVLATVRAALQDPFCMHGLLCTTYFSSPVVIVNGPAARLIGMNSGINALGQGNRANATIGRALQLVIRNVGGGKPGGIDRATLGSPGKYTFCFSEDESEPSWNSLAMDQGFQRNDSVVSLFAGDGVQAVADQRSRTPESLIGTLSRSLRNVCHNKLFLTADALLILCHEHRRIFMEAGWSKQDVKTALFDALRTPGKDIIRGAGGITEGMPESFADKDVDKFRKQGLHILCAGGKAGFFSAIVGGWAASGERGSQLVSQQITMN
ncbi:MAG: hypothetical protein R3332_02505 [Pseudohongiellaceae bacterium]|nr:hypothetical protein [Pseudohongiellaceae bacterium]